MSNLIKLDGFKLSDLPKIELDGFKLSDLPKIELAIKAKPQSDPIYKHKEVGDFLAQGVKTVLENFGIEVVGNLGAFTNVVTSKYTHVPIEVCVFFLKELQTNFIDIIGKEFFGKAIPVYRLIEAFETCLDKYYSEVDTAYQAEKHQAKILEAQPELSKEEAYKAFLEAQKVVQKYNRLASEVKAKHDKIYSKYTELTSETDGVNVYLIPKTQSFERIVYECKRYAVLLNVGNEMKAFLYDGDRLNPKAGSLIFGIRRLIHIGYSHSINRILLSKGVTVKVKELPNKYKTYIDYAENALKTEKQYYYTPSDVLFGIVFQTLELKLSDIIKIIEQ